MTDALPKATRWRLTALLVLIQILALGILTALILHQQRGLLLDLRAARIAVWSGDIELAAQTGHYNGLALAEMKALSPLLERLPQALPEVHRAEVYAQEGETRRVLFALAEHLPGDPIDPRLTALGVRNPALWRSLGEDGLLYVGRQLRDEREHLAGGYVIAADATQLRQQIADARAAFLPLALAAITFSVVLTLWALGLRPLRRPTAASRWSLQRRIVLFAFLVVTGAGVGLVWHATRLFSVELQPAVEGKARAVTEFLQYKLERALALGVPFERLRGVEDYFADTLAQHGDLLALRLLTAEGKVIAQAGPSLGPSVAGQSVESKLAPASAAGARVQAFTDPGYVTQSMKTILADLGIVLLVALLVFNEALRALLVEPLAAGPSAPSNAAGALAAIRLPLFLLILTEELTRAFLPLHIRELATETAVGLPLGLATATGLPMSVYMIGFALATALGGVLAYRVGPARTFAAGVVFTVAGFLWAAVSDGFWQFTATRALCAIGYAFATMACQRLILAHTDDATRAQGLSLLIGAVGMAAICGSAIGGVISERLGAQPVFALCALVGLLGWAVFFVLCRDLAESTPELGTGQPPATPSTFADLGRLLTRPSFSLLMLLAAIPAKIALAGFLFYLAPLALAQEGYSPAAIGRAVMLYFILISVLNPLASRLSDRLGWRWAPVIAGGVIIGAGGLAGALVPALGASEAVLLGILALGLGTGLSAAPLQALASELGSAGGRVTPVATIAAFRTIERWGSAIGPVLAGALLGTLAYGGAMAALGATVLLATLFLPLVPWRWRSGGSSQ